MISSNPARAGHASRVALVGDEARKLGLVTDSVVMTDNLQTVQNSEIHRVIGYLNEMRDVDAALRHTLGL